MRPSHASAKYLKDAPPLPKAVKKEKFAKGLMVKGRNHPSCGICHRKNKGDHCGRSGERVSFQRHDPKSIWLTLW
jgi:hypothetical protein